MCRKGTLGVHDFKAALVGQRRVLLEWVGDLVSRL